MNETRGLWRGKTTPKCSGEAFNNIWVKGDLIHSKELCYIHPFTNSVKVQNELGRLITMHEVDPSTLGECTGLTDKNGKLIFEGDIVKTLETDSNGKQRCFPVVQSHGAFWLYHELLDSKLDFLGSYEKEALEVIGNIHDNPELLNTDD